MSKRDDDLRAAAAGALGGAAATVAMSAVMVAALKTGLMSEMPPQEIAVKSVDRAGAGDEVAHDEKRDLGWLAHFGFGAAAGALYGVLRQRLPTPGPAAVHGSVYALGVWAVSYLGWIPALRLLPPATDDEPGRQPAMVAAHVVFGGLLGALVEPALRRR